jgi:hypothetical protein
MCSIFQKSRLSKQIKLEMSVLMRRGKGFPELHKNIFTVIFNLSKKKIKIEGFNQHKSQYVWTAQVGARLGIWESPTYHFFSCHQCCVRHFLGI